MLFQITVSAAKLWPAKSIPKAKANGVNFPYFIFYSYKVSDTPESE